MLSAIGNSPIKCTNSAQGLAAPSILSAYDRDEEKDMKLAISMLYAFKRELSELHPNCLMVIENLLQQRRY